MREIKFRSWGRYYSMGGSPEGPWVKFYWKLGDECPYPDRKWDCQYTGKKDKNGVEIYGGDVIRCPGEWIGTVRWCEEELQWWADDHDLANLCTSEVIGNIYENPDLRGAS